MTNTIQAGFRLLKRMVLGDRAERAAARYELAMYMRGIDLRGESLDALGMDSTRGSEHACSGGAMIENVFRTLSVSSEDEVVDLGAGKGGAMITLAKLPFRRIDGVEVSPELVRVARRNLARLGCVRGTIFQCDAREFQDLDHYTFIYLYNPFPDFILHRVLSNIQASVTRAPRRLTLVYKNPPARDNPTARDLILASGFRQIREFRHRSPFIRVYQSFQQVAPGSMMGAAHKER